MPSYIPKEELQNYQRWQFDSFDPKPLKPPPVATPEPVEASPFVEQTVVEEVPEFTLPTAEDIERIHREAHEEGYQAGFAEGQLAGTEAGEASCRAEAERLGALVGEMQSAMHGLDQEVADQLLDLALEVARQVLVGHLSLNREALLPIIHDALAALPVHHGQIHLHLNPEDAEFARQHLGEQLTQTGTHIIEDKKIEAGGCLVRSGNSEVDATLPARWKQVLDAIGAHPQAWHGGPSQTP